MRTVAIVGVGLIGGSFALALRKAGFRGDLLGVSSPNTIAEALRLGIIDHGVSLEQAAAQADFIYLAQPILPILETLDRLRPLIGAASFVTDAGSTKAAIVERAQFTRGQFLGGHPMAGKETRGVSEADAGLFAGHPYILTPSEPADLETEAAANFVSWISKIGARLCILESAQHDSILAYVSHLPQLVSTAIANTVRSIGEAPEVAGPAVLAMTRLASSSFDVWGDILATNEPNIIQALEALTGEIERIKVGLRSKSTEVLFESAALAAKKLREFEK